MSCVVCGKTTERGYLCRGHFTGLGSMLRSIEDEAATMDARPSMQQRTGSGGGSLASERTPARLSVIAYLDPRTKRWEPDQTPKYIPPAPKAIGPWCLFCDHETCTAWRAGRRRDLHDDELDAGSAALASVLEELHNWARLVREERLLEPPRTVTITGERDTLTRHLEWIAEQEWVDECYADLRKLLGQLQAVNHTAPDKPVGRCYLPAETGPCGGPIFLDNAAGHAHCARCRSTWDGPQLVILNYEMEQQRAELARPRTADGRRMLTATEMCSQLKMRLNHFRVVVHRRRIEAVNGHYDPKDFTERQSA